jgi:hypothetical protein
MIFDKKMFIFPYKSILLHFLLFSSRYGNEVQLLEIFDCLNLIL